jgi:CRISPR-associated protein Cmr6
MTQARRDALRPLDEYGDHAGLAMQRLYAQHDERGESARELLNAIAKMRIPSAAYTLAFTRWHEAIKPLEPLTFTATTASALAIGLGNASPLEVGLSIHHTYGTPYLPGRAIKGLLRRAAAAHNLDQTSQNILFGATDSTSAGHLTYWDAMLEPTTSTPPFQTDVITVHHPKYYGSSGNNGYPTDFDDPNPVAFLSVRPNTKFCIALSSNSQGSSQWLHLAAELLKYALENIGLGGKTNAGYGYFSVTLPEKPKSDAELMQALLEKHQKRIDSINGRTMQLETNQLLSLLEQEPSAAQGKVLQALLERLDKFGAKKESFYKRAKAMLGGS